MANGFESYDEIRQWKEERISQFHSNTLTLNAFHDSIMKEVFQLAVIRLNKGEPPCRYCWFITGSGGRFEQGTISDQDHGLVFEQDNKEYEKYFLALGKELADGLDMVGYPYCNGNVMSSNPMWCKALEEWKAQLFTWMEDGNLESIRNLQIFYDARCIAGNRKFVDTLRSSIFAYQKHHPQLLKRFMESVMHIKKAINPLGALLVIDSGKHKGAIDLKYSAYIPYVNAIRLLSIKEKVSVTSTLERIDALMHIKLNDCDWPIIRNHFMILLNLRLSLSKAASYEETHYLSMQNLTKQEKKEFKRILKDGRKLHLNVCRLIEKGG
ncbi:DUF294 nucleotidyltransferase-like domain-containing protein [Bacillus benzoevorans]|uniref:CBS domain-containing protein n=1 Tax=Bacillus benzoevorans TaxID=1456 RepID=A0A7X0HS36_9BACI|nr:DUF294 nucleotidyltransferase-like domain-containing protein [Bacillus benzoevorans]MBB6444576.1 CBS domain-containing protein [Bacillus benzoevorans]